MAQRGTGFARKAVETPPPEPRARAVVAETPPAPPEPVPLDLAPLLAPYRKHGRLSLRVERLPHRARLSHGHNNGNHSFSVALDELEGLAYIPPDGTSESPTLGIRIISLDGGDGATLALLDYNVSTGSLAAGKAADSHNEKEVGRLNTELAKLKATLAARESELAEARRGLEASRDLPQQTIDAELATMRASWEAEVEERVAAAVKDTAAKFENARATETATSSKSEKLAQEQLAQERARWQKDAEAALKKAQKDWQAAEATRLAATEAQWRKQSDAALAEANVQLEKEKARPAPEAARPRVDDTELRKLRDELAKTKTALTERDGELTTERAATKKLRDDAAKARTTESDQKNLQDALAKANASLAEREKDLARQRGEAETGLAKLARLNSEFETTKAALAARENELKQSRTGAEQARAEAENTRSGELKRVTAELAGIKASLAVRDAELARARTGNEDARKRWRQESDEALKDAEKRWLDAETERLADAEKLWREHSDKAIAEVVGRLDESESQAREVSDRHEKSGSELARLREERSTLKKLLDERESELVQTRLGYDQARMRWMQETEAALQKAQKGWKAVEAERIAAAQAQEQEQGGGALADLTARLKQTEAALAETRAQAEALRHRGDSDDVRQLRKDYASLQAVLARRESELVQLRSDHDIERDRQTAEARAALHRADQQWKHQGAEDDADEQRAAQIRQTIRNVLIAAGFIGLAAFGYFEIMPMVTATGVLDPILSQDAVPQPPPKSAQASVQPQPTDVVTHTVNLRAGPSTTAAVIGSLPHDTKVITVEHRGKWARVHAMSSGTAKPLEGWAYSTFLKAVPADTKTPAPGPAK
jgi:hypothetical protein